MIRKKGIWVKAIILIAFALIALSLVYAAAFVDDIQAEFDSGTYINTTYNGSSIIMSGGAVSGAYESRIFDAGETVVWENLSLQRNTPVKNYLFAVDISASVWKSTNLGSNWSLAKDDYNGANGNNADDMDSNSSGSLFILHGQDLWQSDDKGISWTLVTDDFNGADGSNGFVMGIDSNDYIYIVDGSEDVWRSDDSGASFTKVNDDLDGGTFTGNTKSIAINSSNAIFVVLSNAEIWESIDLGINWTKVNDDYNGGDANNADDMDSNSSGALFILFNQDVWQSVNNGINWTKVNDDFNGADGNNGQVIFIDENDYIYIAEGSEDIYRSDDSGATFSLLASNVNGGNGNIKGLTSANVSTNLTFQVRSDDDNASWGSFTGHDGTANAYYTASSVQNLNVSDNRYFQYKIYFSSEDNETTPELYNVTVDYAAPDTAPPASITGLGNQSAGQTWIYWNWTNPTDADFNQSIIFVDGSNIANTSNNFYNATGISSGVNHTITVHTKDTNGNINSTDVNSTALTLPNKAPQITLNAPANTSTNISTFRLLNATVSDPDNDLMNITFYGSNSSIFDTLYLLNTTQDVANGSDVVFNWTEGITESSVDDNMVLLMHMNEGSGAIVDYAGQDNNGTAGNVIYGSDGKFNTALNFNGNSSYVDTDPSDNYNFSNTGVTVSAWIYVNGSEEDGDIASHYFSTNNSRVWSLQIRNNVSRFIASSDGTNGGLSYATGSAQIGSTVGWHNLVGSWNKTHLQIFVDGKQDDATPPALSALYSTNQKGIRIGRQTAINWFNGTIDEVVVWNRSLSASEIRELYELKAGTYYWYANATDGQDTAQSEIRQFIVESLCTADLTNTSWASWTNITCLPSDTMNQTRNLTQYDANNCGGANQTFIEYQNVTACDYCTPNLTNTSWASWTNISCMSGDVMNQTRNRTQYDSNYCGEIANQTSTEYQAIEYCDYSAPTILSTSPSNQSSLSAGTTSTLIELTTNEIAVCRYNTSDAAWSNMTQLNNTNATGHNFSVTGLSNGNSYDYYFLCEDDDANRMNSSYLLQFSVASPGGGGGGGGGGSSRTSTVNTTDLLVLSCIESWSCSEWYACVNGVQARQCIDANACETSKHKPQETRPCEKPEDITKLSGTDEYSFVGQESQKFSFEFQEKLYFITVKEIKEQSVIVVIESDQIEAELFLSRPEEFDINSDGNQDVRILLHNIKDGKSSITIKILGSGIPAVTGEAIKVIPYKTPNPYYLIPTILLLIIFIALISMRKSHLSHKKKKVITALHLALMGIILVLFLSAFVKDLPIGAFIMKTDSISENTITIGVIAIAFAIAAVSVILNVLEKKKGSGRKRNVHKSGILDNLKKIYKL